MLHAYLDASGTHRGSPVISISGFVGEESSWLEFDQRWTEVLDKSCWPSRLSEFHMVDCAHGEGEFLLSRWSFAERLCIYGQLTDVISRCQIRPISASVIVECFEGISSADLSLPQADETRLGTPLDVVFHMVTQQLLGAVYAWDRNANVEVWFDEDNTDREDHFAELCERYISAFTLGDIFSGYAFASSDKFSPLQGADLLAYGAYHLAQKHHSPIQYKKPDFPVHPAFWKMLLKLAESPATSPYGTVCNADTILALIGKVKGGDILPPKMRIKSQ